VGPSGFRPWQNDEMRAAIDRRIAIAAGVIPPGAERAERGSLPTFLTAATWVEFHNSLDDPTGPLYLASHVPRTRSSLIRAELRALFIVFLLMLSKRPTWR
jgi:hypothetical protein